MWTEQVVGKIGRDHLEPLLELSEIKGHLSKEIKAAILTLAQLFDGDQAGSALTAREMVALLAQLDAWSGAGSPADAKILPFLVQGNMEGFPLTRQ
jgi:hypothetical protein